MKEKTTQLIEISECGNNNNNNNYFDSVFVLDVLLVLFKGVRVDTKYFKTPSNCY